MPPNLSLSPDAGFDQDPAFSTLSPEEGFILPSLSPEDGFGQEMVMSSLSPEAGFDVASAFSTLSPEEGFILPSLSPEDGFVQPGAIPEPPELAGAAPETAIDRKAVAEQIRKEKDAYVVAIFQKTNMSQELIRTSLERLVSALESGNLYDKWRGIDLIDTIQRTIQERIGKKLGQPDDAADFDRLLDAMGLNKALVEQLRNETMLTPTDKEVYGKFIDKIGGADKTKEKYREILDKGTRSPIEWYLLSLLATQAVGSAGTPEEAQRVTQELQVPEQIQNADLTVVESNKHISELWKKLKNENPALYDKILSLAAKNKDEELTPDDKDVIEGVIAGRVGETALNENFTVLIRPECLRFYIAKKYLAGIRLEDADTKQINSLVVKHLQGIKLTEAERKILLGFETDYQSRNQRLVFDFLREAPQEKVNFEAMSAEEKFAFIVKSANKITRSLQLHPDEDKVATLANLMVLAERLASTLTVDETGHSVPTAYAAKIESIALPDFIKDLGTILREQTPDKVEEAQELFDHYREEKRLYDKQIDEKRQTESLDVVLNRELGLLEDELEGGQLQTATTEATVETPRPQIEIQTSTLANEKHPDRNEDAMFQLPEKRAYGVFDGMGGHAAGNIAANLARDVAERRFQNLPDGLTFEQAQEEVKQTLSDANNEVYKQSQIDKNNMGTTGSLMYIWKGPNGELKLIAGNVGDSRLYLLRNGNLEQITLDDNIVRTSSANEQAARILQMKMSDVTDPETQLDAREQVLFNFRNQISQYLGEKPTVEPRIHTLDLLPGDRLLVCSDGIPDNLRDKEIYDILSQNPNNAAAVKKLTEAAQLRSRDGGHKRAKSDDMTGMIIAIPAETVGKPTGAEVKTTAEMVKEINDLAAIMVDDASYQANIRKYLELTAKYQEQIPEDAELETKDPAITVNNPAAAERFEQDWAKFAEEAARQTEEKKTALPTEERAAKGRGKGWWLLAGGTAAALISVALLLAPLKGEKSTTQQAPTMPPPSAPAQTVPTPGFGDLHKFELGQQVPPKAAEVALPEVIVPPKEKIVYIGGDLTQENHFPTAGHALKAQVKAWFGVDVPPGFTWSDEFNGVWNAAVKAQGLPLSTDEHRPESPLEKVKDNYAFQFPDEVKTAAQTVLKTAGLIP